MVRYFFCIVFILVVFSATVCSAFFQIDEHPNNSRIEHTTIDTPTQGNNIYRIYDNHFSGHGSAYLSLEKEGFIYFDQIKINIPLRLLTKNFTKDDDAIDRMVAANLRIKQLIDEYEKLRHKADLLLRDGSRSPPDRVERDPERQGVAALDEIYDEREKLQKILSSIYRLSNTPAGNTNLNDIIIPEAYANLAAYLDSDKPSPEIVDMNPGVEGSSQKGVSLYDEPFVSGAGPTLNNDEKLPWFFEVVLKLFDYMMNNRVEIILYAVFMILIVFLVSLKVHR